jgi:hypothetical protein
LPARLPQAYDLAWDYFTRMFDTVRGWTGLEGNTTGTTGRAHLGSYAAGERCACMCACAAAAGGQLGACVHGLMLLRACRAAVAGSYRE